MAERTGRRDLLIGLALGLTWLLALVATQAEVGFVRDEGYYFRAAGDYQRWFGVLVDSVAEGELATPFRADTIHRHWHYNTEHPALVKEAQALTWWLFHQVLGLTGHAAGYRLGSMLFVVVLALGTYLLGARLYSRRVGMLGVLLLATMPHVFFHAHLACFDVPITAMTVAVAYAYWRARTAGRWAVWCGLIFGLALCTKHNAFFLLPTLGVFWVLERWREFRLRRRPEPRLELPPVPLAFLWMALLGPLLFLAHWPWLWHDTVARLRWYFNFHLGHEHYPVEYFGELLGQPPFPVGYPFVVSALTVPLVTLTLGLLGAGWALAGNRPLALLGDLGRWLRGRLLRLPGAPPGGGPPRDLPGLFLLWNGLVPVLVIAMPAVPIFGGTKHWMPAMPFLALLAAVGLDRLLGVVAEYFGPLKHRTRWYALAGGLALVPALVGTGHYLANGTAFYNELAGGPEGAARLGMMRQFWGYAARQALPWLNAHAERGARVHFHNTNFDSFRVYQRDGLIRQDLKFAGDRRNADYILFHNQSPMLIDEYQARGDFGTGKPVYGVYVDEAPILVVYKRDPRAGQAMPRRSATRPAAPGGAPSSETAPPPSRPTPLTGETAVAPVKPAPPTAPRTVD